MNGFRAAILAASLCGCASAPLADPTPENPKLGCIPPTMDQQAHYSGRILPTIVRIIGTYEHDEDKWKVLMPGVYDASRWVPVPKDQVKFINCGPEWHAIFQPDGLGAAEIRSKPNG